MRIETAIQTQHYPTLQSDFDAVSGLVYFGNGDELDLQDTWNTHVKILPQAFFDILTQDLPGQAFLMVTSVSAGLIHIEQSATNKTTGDDLFKGKRSIDFNDDYIDSGSLDVINKGNKVGRTYFRNYVELGVHSECEGFKVYASDKNGAYVWAKAGVPLQEETDYTNHNKLRTLLRSRLEAVRDFVYPEVYDAASELIELNSIYDINAIADLDAVISENIYYRYEGGDVVDGDEQERLKNIIKFCADNNKEFTLGRYLLNGATYQGYIDFSDEIAMPRIEKYVGGFKTIELVTEDAPIVSTGVRPLALTA